MVTQPFIDVPLEVYSDTRDLDFDKLIKEYIFIGLKTICNLPECYSEDDSMVNFYVKKYEINDMPPILSINTNINDFKLLNDNKDFINKVFKREIYFIKIKYNLIAFVAQPIALHFVCYFKNLNENYADSLTKWYKFDNTIGYYKEIHNIEYSLYNIRSSEASVLLIYHKA